MVLDKYIRELLFREECVIIPGLGGFVTNYASAEIRGETQSFIPPTKEIGFKADLIKDDGVLTSYMADKLDRPEEVVRETIAEYVRETLARLKEGHTVNLNGIGNLTYANGESIIFRSNLGTNFLLESFGLSSFTFPVLIDERESFFKRSTIFRSKSRPPKETLPGSQNLTTGKDKSTYKIILALAVLLIVSLLPYNSRISESIFRHPASLGPLPSLRHLEAPKGQQDMNSAPLENKVTFPVIAGSFQSVDNAEVLVQKLKSRGYEAWLIRDPRSFYRVIISEFESLNEAQLSLPELQKGNTDLDLWILE